MACACAGLAAKGPQQPRVATDGMPQQPRVAPDGMPFTAILHALSALDATRTLTEGCEPTRTISNGGNPIIALLQHCQLLSSDNLIAVELVGKDAVRPCLPRSRQSLRSVVHCRPTAHSTAQ